MAGGGELNVKGVPFDGAAGFAGSAAGGCSGGTPGVGAGTDSPGFAGAQGGARGERAIAGFSASFGNIGGAAKVEEAAAKSGVGVANADKGRGGVPNSDGVAPAVFGTFDSGTSAGFDCSTAGTVSNEGGVLIAAGLAETVLEKKLGIPGEVGAALDAGATFAGRVGASEGTLEVSGVGGMSDILGRAGAGVKGTGIGAAFTASAVGGAARTGAGLVRVNGSEAIGGSVARVRSCVIVVYAV